nr:15041_t:CDS:2 [Entrophospora candida]
MFKNLLLTVLFLLLLVNGVISQNTVVGKAFDRIAIFVFENNDYNIVINDPNFADFAKKGLLLTNYHAVTHPSQPNYIAMIAGDVLNVVDDNNIDLLDKNIVDLLEVKNISWKSYQENYPGGCFLGETNGVLHQYTRSHNPFISFLSISKNPDLCAKIVSSDQLNKDIDAGTLPQYIFYSPNYDDDGHDTNVTFAGIYAANLISPLLADPRFITNTLVVITYDESTKENPTNLIYTALLGPAVEGKAGQLDDTYYTHYSLLKTCELNWNLDSLGKNDTTAEAYKIFSV